MSELSGVNAATGAGHVAPSDAREAALRKAATEFEAMFVELLLKSAKLPLGGGESTTPVYGDMATSAWSGELGRTGGFGVADLLLRALGPGDDSGRDAASSTDGLGLRPEAGAARYRAVMGDR
jgi:flagellar protein FlgJ